MEKLSMLFAGFATAIMPLVYMTYFQQMRKGSSTPNPATWIVWFSVTVINAFTYTFIVGDIYKAMIAIVTSFLIGAVMLYAFVKGKFGKLGTLEKLVLLATVIIGIFWQTSGQIEIVHLLLQIILLISYVPTIVGLLKGRLKEKHLPWTIVVVAYSFQIAALLVVWNGNWVSLAYPFLNGIIGNGSVAILAIYLSKNTNPIRRGK
ncbi:hypothetical protein ISR92_01230 [Patescibacteria group bacterium]|nr:hypothetical protein [Patescibacteria group bacterium]